MVITNKYWNSENIKAVIKFDEVTEYEVYMDSNEDNFITKLDVTLNEGNSKVNPLGIMTSNSINICIYDADDNLSPSNEDSIYRDKIMNGIEIDLYISFDGLTWESYGKWYTTSWSGSFNKGGHDIVSITAEDRLNTLGNMELPLVEASANVPIGDLITNVLRAVGLDDGEFYIDSRIDTSMTYGVTVGTKVREFLNNVCQMMFIKVIVDRAGIICFVPATDLYNDSNEITIYGEDTGSLQNKNVSNIDYSKVRVKYISETNKEYKKILDNQEVKIRNGYNEVSLKFEDKVLSIEELQILTTSPNNTCEPTQVEYQGYQDGVNLSCNNNGEDATTTEIIAFGYIAAGDENYTEEVIEGISVAGGPTFEFDSQQIMSSADADLLCANIVQYIEMNSKNVVMSGTAITPKLYLEDKVTLSDTGTFYDGVYKVIELNLRFGDDYNMDMTLVRLIV